VSGAAVPALWWFDRWDERVGVLPVAGSLVHTEELNGEDTLEFESGEVPAKGDRLVWLDGGSWREHVVVRTDEPLEGPCRVYAESSLCELLDDYVEEARVVGRGAAEALGRVLSATRWRAGRVDAPGTASFLLYHLNALAALRKVADAYGAEVSAEVDVDAEAGRVSARRVNLVGALGSWRGLRLSYGRNLAGCTRSVLADEVCTALYGWGAGLPHTDEDGNYVAGYRRKLGFAEVNGGAAYVADEEARELWGRWDEGRAAKAHAFGQVTFPDCTDPEELLALTRRALAEASRPKVSYEVDAAELGLGGCSLGDEVAVVDASREPAWRLTARVVRRVRTFGDEVSCRATVGSAQRADYARLSTVAAEVEALQDDVAGIDGNLSAAVSAAAVEVAVRGAVDALGDLSDEEF
jgi:phage minor structural protein